MTDDLQITPVRVTGAEPAPAEPVYSYRFDPCVAPSCGRLNRRLATEPPALRCPACGAPTVQPGRRPLTLDGNREAR